MLVLGNLREVFFYLTGMIATGEQSILILD